MVAPLAALYNTLCVNRYRTMRGGLDFDPWPPRNAANPSSNIGERERLDELTSGFAIEARSEMQLRGLTSGERRRVGRSRRGDGEHRASR
jgi:hypothetical protein